CLEGYLCSMRKGGTFSEQAGYFVRTHVLRLRQHHYVPQMLSIPCLSRPGNPDGMPYLRPETKATLGMSRVPWVYLAADRIRDRPGCIGVFQAFPQGTHTKTGSGYRGA